MSAIYMFVIITYITLWLKVIFGFLYWCRGVVSPKKFFNPYPSPEYLVTLRYILLTLITRAFGLFAPLFLIIARKESFSDLGALFAMSVYGIILYVSLTSITKELREDCEYLWGYCNDSVKYFRYGPWGLVGTYKALISKGGK